MKTRIKSPIALLISASMLVGCNTNVTQKPPSNAEEIKINSTPSVLAVHFAPTLAAINKELIPKLPTQLPLPLSGSYAGFEVYGTGIIAVDPRNPLGIESADGPGFNVKGRVNVTLDWHLHRPETYTMVGPARVGHGDGIDSIPLPHIGGGIIANEHCDVSVDSNRTAHVSVRYSGLSWPERLHATVLGGDVDLVQIFGSDPFIKAIKGFDGDYTFSLEPQIAQVWHTYSADYQVAGQTAKLIFIPRQIGFSGVTTHGGQADFSCIIAADTQVSFGSDIPAMLPAPVTIPQVVPPTLGGFNIQVPVSVSYDALESTIKVLLSENGPLSGAAPALGKVTISVDDVMVDATRKDNGNALAVGVKFKLTCETKHLVDTEGVVWLTAVPALGSDGKTFSLINPDYTAVLNNPLWEVASVVFHGEVVKRLRDGAKLDLSTIEPKLTEAVNSSLASMKSSSGISMSVTRANLTMKSITVNPKSLTAVVSLTGTDVVK